MKAIKRLIAIILLVGISALVGYLIFTGSRLPELNEEGGINAALSII